MIKSLVALIGRTLNLLLGGNSQANTLQFFQVEQDYFAAKQADQAVALFTETYGKSPSYVDTVHPWTLLKGRTSAGMPVELTLSEVLRQSIRRIDKQQARAVHLSLSMDM